MKHLMIATLIAIASPAALAGDLQFGFGYGRAKAGQRVEVRVGYGDRHVDRGRRHGRRAYRHRPRQHCRRHWVRGYYNTVERQVWVPGYHERAHHPAGYGRVRRPGRYVTRHAKVWVPGRWTYVCNTPGHRHR